MTNPLRMKIQRILREEGASPDLQLRVLNRMSMPTKQSAWHHLIAPLEAAIRTMRNASPKWRTARRPTYAAYLQLMEKTLANISAATREYETPAEAERAAAAANIQRAAEGKRPLGECRSHWSTWIPPHIREATVLAFDALYASPEEQALPPGRRVHPFTTLTQRGELVRKWDALLDQVKPHLTKDGDTIPAEYLEAATRGLDPDAAAGLASALQTVQRMRYQYAQVARKTILARKRNHTNAGDLIVPLHWTHVLNEDARARLRAAEKAAGGDGYTRPNSLPIGQPASEALTPGYIAPREDKLAAIAATAAADAARQEDKIDEARTHDSEDWTARVESGEL